MSQGKIPDAIMEGIRLGRLTALRKPDGVRIVVGDIHEEVGSEDHGKANCQEGGESYSPVPARPDHKSRL